MNQYLPGKSPPSGKKLATKFKQRIDEGQNLVVCLVFKEVRRIIFKEKIDLYLYNIIYKITLPFPYVV